MGGGVFRDRGALGVEGRGTVGIIRVASSAVPLDLSP
jgi:hypothetical protein